MADEDTQTVNGTGFTKVRIEPGIRQIGPKKWEVRVHAGRDPVSNKLIQKSRTVEGGIKEARKVRAEMIVEITKTTADAAEQAVTRATEVNSFGHLLDEWLQKGRGEKERTTIDGYEKKIEKTIRPALGDIPLAEITAKTLDDFYERTKAEGVSPATVMHFHRIISAALMKARKWGYVSVNVAQNATPPSVTTKKFNVPSPERVHALIDLAGQSRVPEWANVITVAALTGMRRGELCGLQWSDVDWDTHTITVRRSIWQVGREWGTKDPKTHQERTLEIGPDCVGVLQRRLERVTESAAMAEIELSPDAYIFSPDLDGAVPMKPSTMTLAFGRFCKKMAETTGEAWPYRFHDLRHYTATELFANGHQARTVADRLGHADPALTLRVYTHDTPAQAKAAAASLEAGLGLSVLST